MNFLEEGVAIFDGEGNVKFMNQRLKESLGKEGRTYYESLRSVELIGLIQETYQTRTPQEKGITFRDRTYAVRTFLYEDGVGILVKDITDRELMKETQKEFLANLSHELKTPLAVVMNTLETLLDMEEESVKRELIGRALKRVKEAISLTETVYMLSFSKGKGKVREEVNLEEVLSEVLKDLEENIKEKEISVEIDLKEKCLKGNREEIKVIIRNLLQNAVEYNKRGGKVLVETRKDENAIVLSVEDTGIGIENRKIPLILEPFVKGEESKGLGLGLALVKKIAQNYGAKINIQSERGKGTKVEIRFPEKV
ncbi:sensor histidine kinase [Aquifex aeolicus]|uniref:histidine kinase n=1 Tax=Aquifex aeolicus (strain VF5) TaxID=224324 RepID=O66656_AQUAE|nr:HAMP domain-containing sensor histidine kinase [Aquifex aeolicus]AAC06610.1 histidine kinase sensor protein [Aquifex aeolicus VF5]